MIFVNDIVSTIGFTRDILSHFEFSLWDPKHDSWILIKHPTIDDYIFLCDREVNEWTFSDTSNDKIDIYVDLEEEDRIRFKDQIIYG